jgi:hypothetical protein
LYFGWKKNRLSLKSSSCLTTIPEISKPAEPEYRDYVRNPANGYVSQPLPIDEGNGNEFKCSRNVTGMSLVSGGFQV